MLIICPFFEYLYIQAYIPNNATYFLQVFGGGQKILIFCLISNGAKTDLGIWGKKQKQKQIKKQT